MDKYKPLSKKAKKEYRKDGYRVILVGLLIFLFSLIPVYYGWEGAKYWIVRIFGLSIIAYGIYRGFYQDKELTDRGIEEEKIKYAKFWSKPLVRYIGAFFMLGLAFLSFTVWDYGVQNNIRHHTFVSLLANPYFSIFAAIVAVFNAWELSLAIIVAALIWFVVQGVLAMSVSIAIVIGFSILSLVVFKTKNKQ